MFSSESVLTKNQIDSLWNSAQKAVNLASKSQVNWNGLNYVPSDNIKIWGNYKTEVKNMENLYQVYIIDKKKNFIINGEVVVAKDEEDAKFELQVTEKVRAEGLKLSEVTIIVKQLGTVKVEEENK